MSKIRGGGDQILLGTLDTGSIKECVVATTASIDLSTGTLLTIDGVTLVAGERVLVKNQSSPAENGIYQANVGAWTRVVDAGAGTGQLHGGQEVGVREGTIGGKATYMLTAPLSDIVDVGTDTLVFEKISQTGGLTAAGFIWNEDATGLVNGSNTVYTTSVDFLATKLGLYKNGLRENLGVDYTETDTDEITTTVAPKGNPVQADELVFDYLVA